MKGLFYLPIIFFLSLSVQGIGQVDSIQKKLTLNADFRFRAEGDWNSRKSDGTYRTDRTRFRYRLRFGFKYRLNNWAYFGGQIRTGNPMKQQDPQLTVGDGFKEFGTIPIGFDKMYFQAKHRGVNLWLGKNSFPFKKNGELFWSDNVNPEGIFVSKIWTFDKKMVNDFGVRAGHFIISTNGTTLDRDAFMSGAQITTTSFHERLLFNPAIYHFGNIPNIPDGGGTYTIDYSIIHLNSKFKVWKKKRLNLEFDYYMNLQDYNSMDSISTDLRDQKQGYSIGVCYGKLKKKHNIYFMATYMRMERFSAVDFLAQNDWVRWDYSNHDSPDGRLTNYQGIELVAGIMLTDKISLKAKYYMVEQLVRYGDALENGNRIRLDLDVRF